MNAILSVPIDSWLSYQFPSLLTLTFVLTLKLKVFTTNKVLFQFQQIHCISISFHFGVLLESTSTYLRELLKGKCHDFKKRCLSEVQHSVSFVSYDKSKCYC